MSQIIDFVIFSLPSPCLKCEAEYVPYVQENSAENDVKCFVCQLPAHRECYSTDDVNHHLVYLCQVCLVAEKKEPTINRERTPPPAADAEEKPVEPVPSTDESTDTTEEESGNDWEVKRKKKYRKHKYEPGKLKKIDEICPLLLEGKCPHGISGKQCEYKHKNLCYKYSSFGTKDMHRAGCRFGKDCRYLHPTLCKNSVVMKMCLNKKCTYAHLRYTKREQQHEEVQTNTYRKPMLQKN